MPIQSVVLSVSLVLMAGIAWAFVRAIRLAGTGPTPTESTRQRLIVVMVVVGLIVTLGSLARWPHALSDTAGTRTTVNVTGAMWYWNIDRTAVPLGVPVVFNAHTSDVTHGFGVLDPDDRLLFQTQAMPGYVNRVEHVFRRPGVHRVVCLEFCGLAHHAMVSEFTVASAN